MIDRHVHSSNDADNLVGASPRRHRRLDEDGRRKSTPGEEEAGIRCRGR